MSLDVQPSLDSTHFIVNSMAKIKTLAKWQDASNSAKSTVSTLDAYHCFRWENGKIGFPAVDAVMTRKTTAWREVHRKCLRVRRPKRRHRLP